MARDSRRGAVWIALIFLIIATWTALTATLSVMAHQYRSLNRQHLRSAAQYLAEAGIAKALWELPRDASYTGEADTKLEMGTFSVVVRGEEIFATGYIPDRVKPQAEQTVTVRVRKEAGGYRALSWRRR